MLPLRKIICPTDFSDASRAALAHAGSLAAHFDAELLLLHVTPPLSSLTTLAPYAGMAAFDTSGYEEAMRAESEKSLRALLADERWQNVRAASQLRWGQPADEIVAAAREDADLIVIATHGRSGWRRHVFGSVAERVLRRAPCPVFTVTDGDSAAPAGDSAAPATEPVLPLQKIVCPTDFSEPSFAALKVADAWAQRFAAQLLPLHVTPALQPLEQPTLMADRPRLEESMQADAMHQLRRVLEEQLPERALQTDGMRPLVRKGNAAEEIAAAATQENADLIVIATHGAGAGRCVVCGTAIEHALFGSTVTNVVRLAPCPVLTVPAEAM